MARKRDSHADEAELQDKRKPGWFWMDDAILETYGKRIAPYGIAVYALLAKHANKDAQAWPSLNSMVETLGISRQSIVRTLEKLIAEKLISKEMRTSAYGDYASNIYTLLPLPKGTSHENVGTSPQDQHTSSKDQRVRPHRGEGTSPDRLEPEVLEPDLQVEPDSSPTGEDMADSPNQPPPSRPKYTQTFERFWEEYPSKVGKKAAWQRWKAQKLEAIGELVIQSVIHHRARDQNWHKGYVPHPKTYLSQGRYEDEFPEHDEQDLSWEARQQAAITRAYAEDAPYDPQ